MTRGMDTGIRMQRGGGTRKREMKEEEEEGGELEAMEKRVRNADVWAGIYIASPIP